MKLLELLYSYIVPITVITIIGTGSCDFIFLFEIFIIKN